MRYHQRRICRFSRLISLQEQLLSPGKAISAPEEVALLATILNSTGRANETIKLLQGSALNMDSRIGKLDPQLTLSKLLQSFEVAEQWDEAFEYTQTLLSDPAYQSDDRVWTLWLKSQAKSSTPELVMPRLPSVQMS